MIRLPGYGDHLAATVDPDIHQRQAHARRSPTARRCSATRRARSSS